MNPAFDVLTIVLAVIIVLLILIQGRGAGLGSAWGGGAEQYQSRRGVEKWVMRGTAFAIFCFFVVTLVVLAL